MPGCRIYFFTYKRSALLLRAIKSLQNQTYKDWTCEVHNDCPGDLFPQHYIDSLNDDRFIVKNHSRNLGGTHSFNLAFSGCEEKYASILEDDNWWEPDFLQDMTAIMEGDPNLDIAWSNMRVWKENDRNEWEDTGKTVWPLTTDRSFSWPQQQQAMGALYSNGAMIYKGEKATNYLIPDETLFDCMEMIRERTFSHPLYLHNKVLANFSITASTHRSNTAWKWTACQAMYLSSFVVTSGNKGDTFFNMLSYYRDQKPNPVATFILANIFLIKDKSLYRLFTMHDWYMFIRWVLKTNFKLIQFKNYLASQNKLYNFLIKHTGDRYNAG